MTTKRILAGLALVFAAASLLVTTFPLLTVAVILLAVSNFLP
jgi:hypothetical protein